MESTFDAPSAVTLAVWLVVQLLTAQDTMVLPPAYVEEGDSMPQLEETFKAIAHPVEDPLASMHLGLNAFCCSAPPLFLDDDGFWVKPRSTMWFSRFLMEDYDDQRWLETFRMSKRSVFALADVLRLRISRKDTRKSSVTFVGYHLLWVPSMARISVLQNLCGLPSVVGAIDGTHICIAKPRHVPFDYYYFKSGGYTLNCQAVVDSNKRFLDLYLGVPGSTHDSCMLRRSSLYNLATHSGFFTNMPVVDGVSPYLLGDQGYPLLPWLMVSHRQNVPPSLALSLAESVFNRKLWKGQSVVKNAFGILKQTFRELLNKSELDVVFLPDLILSCAILHNILLSQSEEDVQQLFGVLMNEGLLVEVADDTGGDLDAAPAHEAHEQIPEMAATRAVVEKRRLLGLRLSAQRLPLP